MRKFFPPQLSGRSVCGAALNTASLLTKTPIIGTASGQVRHKYAPREKNASAPWTDYDALGSKAKMAEASVFANHQDAMEEKSLDDAKVAVEELSGEELSIVLSTIRQNFNPAMYALVTLPAVDVVLVLNRNDLLPKIDLENQVMRYLMDPRTSLRRPEKVEQVMGKQRFIAAQDLLVKELEEYNRDASPIYRTLKKNKLPTDLWAPVLRGLVVELVVTHGSGLQFPAVILALAAGKGAAELGLEADLSKRVRQVADLAIAAGQEFGLSLPADIALQLLKANNIETDRAVQKQMTQVMARSAARDVDWKLRESGLIKQSAPMWIAKYSAKIDGDISVGLSLEDLDPSGSEFDPELMGEDGEEEGDARLAGMMEGGGEEDAAAAAVVEKARSGSRGAKKSRKGFADKMTERKSANAPGNAEGADTSDYFARSRTSSEISDILSRSVDKKLKQSKQRALASNARAGRITSSRGVTVPSAHNSPMMGDTTEL